MFNLRTLVRPLLAAPFIVGGISNLRRSKPAALSAAASAAPTRRAGGSGIDPETLAKVNGGVQVGAGAILALGFIPRLASLALSASLVSTTITEHRFWEEREPSTRKRQMIQFTKDAGLLGGLLASALDTGGRPSVFWSGRRAAERAAHNVADTVSGVYHTLPVVS
jgi:putative oxidoreductase